MNKIWIGNGQLVLPDKIVPGGSVLLEGKKIAAVNVPCPPDARRVDVDGSYIMAGFVDIHVHGGGDSDFMDEEASAFPTIAKAHCAHGTTALCPTTMTCADSLLEKTIDLFLEADKEPENGAELLGLHLEGPYFSAALGRRAGAAEYGAVCQGHGGKRGSDFSGAQCGDRAGGIAGL